MPEIKNLNKSNDSDDLVIATIRVGGAVTHTTYPSGGKDP